MLSLLWIGWTSSAKIPWLVPFLSGVPFGAGYLLIFMSMLNHLTDAYQTFSASAQSAASCTRSILGAVIPLAAKPMIHQLGIHWAYSLNALLALVMSLIPFAFIRYGDAIRANSTFSQQLGRPSAEPGDGNHVALQLEPSHMDNDIVGRLQFSGGPNYG